MLTKHGGRPSVEKGIRERKLKMEAQRDEPCGLRSAPTQAKRQRPVITFHPPASQSIIILLPKQLQINIVYLNENLHFFVFFVFLFHNTSGENDTCLF